MNDNDRIITSTLSMQEFQFVLNAIGQQPYVQAEPVIKKLVAQANSQLQEPTQLED